MIPPRVHPYVLRTWADREMYCVDCIITEGVWHLQPCPKNADTKVEASSDEVLAAAKRASERWSRTLAILADPLDATLCPTCGCWTRWSHGHELCDCDN